MSPEHDSSPEAADSPPAGSEGHQRGQMLVVAFLLAFVGTFTLLIVADFSEDALEFRRLRDLIFCGLLSWWLYNGSRSARYVVVVILLLASVYTIYAAFTTETNRGAAFASAAIFTALFLFSSYVFLLSRSAIAFLSSQKASTKTRVREHRQRMSATQNLVGYCEFCRKEVKLESDYCCPLCNWPVEKILPSQGMNPDASD